MENNIYIGTDYAETGDYTALNIKKITDGHAHVYAVYYIHENGEKTLGYAESVCIYNPGEVVQFGGLRCVIDFEI